MNKTLATLITGLFTCAICQVQAQDPVTNAFDDLERQGTVNEQDSEMRRVASSEALNRLLLEKPAAGYFCFTEDRMHDIRLSDAIPARWTERPVSSRTSLKGICVPGEYYTWQIGLFAPYQELEGIAVTFSDLKNERGNKIASSSFTCFNLEGVDTNGKTFKKALRIPKGNVQALWIGSDIPVTAQGTYKGTVTVCSSNAQPTQIAFELTVEGQPIENHGDNEGWRKTRLRWLNSTIGNRDEPTEPYIPLNVQKQTLSWLGGTIELAKTGLPRSISTCYDASNQLDTQIKNPILTREMQFVIETESGTERVKPGSFRITHQAPSSVKWTANQKNKNFEITYSGELEFDGMTHYQIQVKALRPAQIKDIRLEVPYTAYASRYMMGIGHKGGLRPDSLISWQWDIEKHQDQIWMGNVNAGLNICLKDQNYVRPLVNIYYSLGKLNLPISWGNENKGGMQILPQKEGETLLQAYSGARSMQKGETLHYNFDMLVTPVKPLNLKGQAQERFYHSNSDVSAEYISAAQKAGANMINVHHKKDIYPFINYPYHDESVSDLKHFITQAHQKNIDVRLYYTTRELTVKIPELWAFRSLGSEVIHDGPGKDARTLIHRNGPNEWLNKNLTTHFIPAWYNAFKEGKYAGDMDISVITTPDSRWNNYYLAGLDWMIKNLGLDGVYIDDSALDHKTLQRARRILDADGKRRLIDIHSWNHMNQWAGYANSLHLYTELLPYVDRTWIGEGFNADHPKDFWLVEMSGIPFGLMSETLDAPNIFRGMIYGMLPRLPWSGNPVPLWKLWDEFGMKDAVMRGYWDDRCPVTTDNENLPSTVYIHGDQALVVIANWTDLPQKGQITINEELLGFKPSTFILPEIRNTQWGGSKKQFKSCEVLGRSGLILLLQK